VEFVLSVWTPSAGSLSFPRSERSKVMVKLETTSSTATRATVGNLHKPTPTPPLQVETLATPPFISKSYDNEFTLPRLLIVASYGPWNRPDRSDLRLSTAIMAIAIAVIEAMERGIAIHFGTWMRVSQPAKMFLWMSFPIALFVSWKLDAQR
jgi:hypothetical protein